MIRFLSVVILALALSLAGCSSGGNVEVSKAPTETSTTAGCKCCDKPKGSRPDCSCKDKAKVESPACKSCDKAANGTCPAAGTSETKAPEAEK